VTSRLAPKTAFERLELASSGCISEPMLTLLTRGEDHPAVECKPCLLPATRRPRRCGHRSNGMRAMDQGHADARCTHGRFEWGVKAVDLRAPGVRAATTARGPGTDASFHPAAAA
jgi:hypothetical protein